MNKLTTVTPVDVSNLDVVAPKSSQSSAGASTPVALTWQLHTHCFSWADGLQRLGVLVVIILLALLMPTSARVSSSVEYLGCNRVAATGRRVLQRRPMRRCAGLVPTRSMGVLRQSKSAKNSDWPDSLYFLKRHLTVWTAFSAFLLDCG